MSATVLARSYNESAHHHHFMVASEGLEPRPPTLRAPSTAASGVRSSSLRRDRPRPAGSGMRISFASDTRFIERPLRSRTSSRSAATSSYNLRPMQGSGRPSKVKVRLPKATAATGFKYHVTSSEGEYLNPRKALDIAKSYGIPKYFLRGNTQVLTDGRMRLFGDNVWKKERTSLTPERATADSSDVINRLIDSVDKAIATSKKLPPPSDDDSAIKLEIISLKSGADDKMSMKGSIRSLQGATNPPNSTTASTVDGGRDGDNNMPINSDVESGTEKRVSFGGAVLGEASSEESLGAAFHDIRPHTVDTTPGTLVRYLPKMLQRGNEMKDINGSFDNANGVYIGNPQTPGSRSRQLASPFRGVSGSVASNHRLQSLDGKYQNVLPRFYPAVSAHRNKQAEAEKAARYKKKSSQQRLVRFADTHTVRFSNESSSQEPIPELIAQRAPVQSIQRALDSHSGLSNAEKLKKQRDIIEDPSNYDE